MKKRLKRLICKMVGHRYIFRYRALKYRKGKVTYKNVMKCSTCAKIIYKNPFKTKTK